MHFCTHERYAVVALRLFVTLVVGPAWVQQQTSDTDRFDVASSPVTLRHLLGEAWLFGLVSLL